jgi:hypothetical protein
MFLFVLLQLLTNFLRRLTGIELLNPSLSVFGLMLTSMIAYFTLLTNLSNTLETVEGLAEEKTARSRLNTLNFMARILRALAVMSMVLLLAHIGRVYAGDTTTTEFSSYSSFILILIAFWTPLHLLVLVVAGYLCVTMIYKFKRDDALIACSKKGATIHFKGGRKLSGNIYDFGFLKDNVHFLSLCRNCSKPETISLADVAAIFLEEEYCEREELKNADYINGRLSLTLLRPHEEKLPTSRHFRANGFTILELEKPTTNSRYAIVDDLQLRGI